MGMSVRVRVPATSANLGAGFDCLGMALSLHNVIEMEEAPGGLALEIEGEGADSLPRGSDNLVIRVARKLFDRVGWQPAGLRVRLVNAIPPARGLGSSSAAICGALLAANALAGSQFDREELLQMAAAIEGHPDNVTPALFGGLTAACMADGRALHVRLDPPPDLNLALIIPDQPLSTEEARAILPQQVPLGDAVYNIQRACLFLAALQSRNLGLLREALRDRLHQPYRAALLPGLSSLLSDTTWPGILGGCLSGSGSAVLVFLDPAHDPGSQLLTASLGEMAASFIREGIPCRIIQVAPDSEGAVVLPND